MSMANTETDRRHTLLIVISQNVSPSWKLRVPMGPWGLLERLKGPDSSSQTPSISLCDLKQVTSSLGLLIYRVRVGRGLSALHLSGRRVNAASGSESTQKSAEAGFTSQPTVWPTDGARFCW